MTKTTRNDPNLTDLLQSVSRYQQEEGELPPVHLWNPPLCDNVQMRIDRNGRWYYMDSPIGRERMVRMFSRILRRDEDGYHYLVTPAEKVRVRVEDCPFVITGWDSAGTGRKRVMTLCTNTQDRFALDDAHPLRVEKRDGNDFAPRVMVRAGLDARVGRSVFYQWAEIALAERGDEEDGAVGIYSCGVFFSLQAQGEKAPSGQC